MGRGGEWRPRRCPTAGSHNHGLSPVAGVQGPVRDSPVVLLTSSFCLWLRTPGSPVQTRTPSSAFFWENRYSWLPTEAVPPIAGGPGSAQSPLRLSLHTRQTALTPFHRDGMRTGTELLSSEGPPGLQFFLASQTRGALRESSGPGCCEGLPLQGARQSPGCPGACRLPGSQKQRAGAVVAAHRLEAWQQ